MALYSRDLRALALGDLPRAESCGAGEGKGVGLLSISHDQLGPPHSLAHTHDCLANTDDPLPPHAHRLIAHSPARGHKCALVLCCFSPQTTGA